jgi:hypothetical protein
MPQQRIEMASGKNPEPPANENKLPSNDTFLSITKWTLEKANRSLKSAKRTLEIPETSPDPPVPTLCWRDRGGTLYPRRQVRRWATSQRRGRTSDLRHSDTQSYGRLHSIRHTIPCAKKELYHISILTSEVPSSSRVPWADPISSARLPRRSRRWVSPALRRVPPFRGGSGLCENPSGLSLSQFLIRFCFVREHLSRQRFEYRAKVKDILPRGEASRQQLADKVQEELAEGDREYDCSLRRRPAE